MLGVLGLRLALMYPQTGRNREAARAVNQKWAFRLLTSGTTVSRIPPPGPNETFPQLGLLSPPPRSAHKAIGQIATGPFSPKGSSHETWQALHLRGVWDIRPFPVGGSFGPASPLLSGFQSSHHTRGLIAVEWIAADHVQRPSRPSTHSRDFGASFRVVDDVVQGPAACERRFHQLVPVPDSQCRDLLQSR